MANPIAEALQIRNYNAKNYWVGQGAQAEMLCSDFFGICVAK